MDVDVYIDYTNGTVAVHERGGDLIEEIEPVLLLDPEFVPVPDDPNESRPMIRGTVSGSGMDAYIEWNMMVRMASNDVSNVDYDPVEMDGFEIIDAVRTDQHGHQVGDVVESATYAYVVLDGAGVMFEDIDADSDEETIRDMQG